MERGGLGSPGQLGHAVRGGLRHPAGRVLVGRCADRRRGLRLPGQRDEGSSRASCEPAGYRLISDIRPARAASGSRSPSPSRTPAGDPVRGLLPAHLFKDAPGGWQCRAGGRFPRCTAARSPSRRWTGPRRDHPGAQRALVGKAGRGRPAGAPPRRSAGHGGALRSGNTQFALSRTDSTGLKLLGELGNRVRLHTVAKPRLADVLLRPSSPELADDRSRRCDRRAARPAKLIDEGRQAVVRPRRCAPMRLVTAALGARLPGRRCPARRADRAGSGEGQANCCRQPGYTKDAGTWREATAGNCPWWSLRPASRSPTPRSPRS